MFISTSPTPLPMIQATPEPRVNAPQPVKAPNFANLLRQQSRAATAPVKPPVAAPAPPSTAEATSEPNPADGGTPAASANAAQRSRVASNDRAKSSATKAPAKAESNDTEADAAERTARSSDTQATTAEHPLLAHWLSHLQRPVDATAEMALGAAARGTSAEDEASTSAADTQNATSLTSSLALPGGQAGSGHDPANAGPASLAAATEHFAQRLDAAAVVASASAEAATSRNRDAEPAAIDASSATPGAAAGFAASVASASLRPAEPTAVAITTPVNAPDFSQVLGVQLSVLAKDGIQHAELHLNPADMGPVSVQIEMNGSQARIDFGADVAATRHAIEAGLPELASALRDAGFTLSGGGVSQHSRGGSEPGGEEARRNGRGTAAIDTAEDSATAAASLARRTVAIGGLDLYA